MLNICPRCGSVRIERRTSEKKRVAPLAPSRERGQWCFRNYWGVCNWAHPLVRLQVKVGVVLGGLGGGLLGGLFGGAVGCAVGSTVGEAVDKNILDNLRCLDCQFNFAEELK